MKTFRQFINERLNDDKLKQLKTFIINGVTLDTIDINVLGKYLLDRFYNLSLLDNSNLITPVDDKKIRIPGTDSYNFNNVYYYKYNYDKYNFRHPMDLDDVIELVDKIYKHYGDEYIDEITDFINNMLPEE